MRLYEKAYDYADQCLSLTAALLDYNTLDLNKTLTFQANGADNPEVIFMATCPSSTSNLRILTFQNVNPDSSLLSDYEPGDLRYRAFYQEGGDGKFNYRGSYDGTSRFTYFTGLATDEMYLVRAEAAARLGRGEQALSDLNALRKHRYQKEGYNDIAISDPVTLLDRVLAERRKELVFRGRRWEDLRRLNKDPHTAKTLIRNLRSGIKKLEPGSPRYVWPLPAEAIRHGGYQQNVR